MKIIKSIFIASSILLSQASFADDDKHEAGEKLFKANCAVCHGVAAGGMDMTKRIAPPIAAVRMHYIDTYPDESSFVEAVSSWVAKQENSRSLMPGAIQKFKIMPPLAVSEEDAKKIAAYIFAGDIETPEGFAEHVKEQHGKMGMGMGMMQGKNMHQKGMGGMQGQGKGKHMMQGKGMSMQGKGMGMNKMRQAMMEKMRREGGGKRGSMSAKMMQKLNLSPQQQQQMQVLIQEKESRIKPIKKEIRQISQTLHQLDTTSPNYKNQIFSLADEKAKRVHRMVIEKGEMRMKIESILSVEQRTKFKQLRQQRRDKKQSRKGN